jgi:fructose-1,6-bisphosphatase I
MQDVSQTLKADGANPQLIALVETLLGATRNIAQCIHQGALAGVLGSTTDENVQGETQKKLDVIANQMLKDCLLDDKHVCAIASEEEDTLVAGNQHGAYVVAFDPLDGSSNIDINGQVGTIFTIYPVLKDVAFDSELQFRQPGTQQVCAGYVLYGGSTLLVMSTGVATRCFTLDAATGNFLLTEAELAIPVDTREFAINLSNQRFWSAPFKRYVDDLIAGETGPRKKNYNMRWNAAMVGDVHRVLIRGGIFSYPSDNRNPKQPAKLRLLYEANPMAMLIEGAGGKAFTETQRILTLEPAALHQRVAVILGSANEVDACLQYLH